MSWSSALPVAIALVSATIISRRQVVWKLGAYGGALATPLLLIVWFTFLSLGQLWGSLAAMAWTATVPLVGIGGIALVRFKRRRLRPLRWTVLDKITFGSLALLILAYNGNDNIWHYSIVNTYLRGNIPPCSFNDPGAPLPYHSLFDAAAAVVADGFALVPERALDVVTILCVFGSIACLQAVSRMLFAGRWCHQVARLFFVVGFGPVYLTLLLGDAVPDERFFFHGRTTQAFAAAIFRRPVALSYVLFLFLLASVLPRLASRPGRAHLSKAIHVGFLAPCAYLMPQASEELLVFAAVLAVVLLASGKTTLRWVFVCIGTALASVPMSPLLRATIPSGGDAPATALTVAWPPSLPRWEPGFITDGLPLFSIEALWVCAVELGPVFLGALWLSARDARRRALTIVFLVGIVIACSFRYHASKVYLDRFLFYCTSAGFMLSAAWIEKLERDRRPTALPRWLARAAGVIFIVVPTVLGPAGYAVRHIVRGFETGFREPYVPLPPGELRRLLSPVGPREQVLTDAKYAQSLVLAGFIVAAPVASPEVVMVLDEELPSYLQSHPDLNPPWLLLPAIDPRVARHPVTAEFGGYVLVRRPQAEFQE